MKKFLKVFIVVLLVLGVIGGTCYFFFVNLRKRNMTTSSIAAYLESESKLDFNSDLSVVRGIMNGNKGDDRFDLIVTTNNRLDSIMSVVASYYVDNNTQVVGKNITKTFNATKGAKIQLQAMMDEYVLKSSNSSYFDKALGANDLYLQACTYLLNYARTINLIQNTLQVNRNSNVKFNLFDAYTYVVLNTFDKTNIEQLRTAPLKVTSPASINVMNNYIKFDGYTIKLANPTSSAANNFDEYYSKCDRNNFAVYLASNIQTVSTENQETNEKMATFYLKSIFGI